MNGIKANKELDSKTQICAGYKIHPRKELFYKYSNYPNSGDLTKVQFEKTSPIEYGAKTDVQFKTLFT